MANNLFLTGKKGAGKTAMIIKVIRKLGLDPGGFMVGREEKNGNWLKLYFQDPREVAFKQNPIYQNYHQQFNPESVFAFRDPDFSTFEVKPEVFTDYGLKLLDSGSKVRDIVIMDELGRFELNATGFLKKVEVILDNPKPVLGVLKNENNFFLDKIRRRPDIDLYYLNENNRKDVFQRVLKQTKELVEERSG